MSSLKGKVKTMSEKNRLLAVVGGALSLSLLGTANAAPPYQRVLSLERPNLSDVTLAGQPSELRLIDPGMPRGLSRYLETRDASGDWYYVFSSKCWATQCDELAFFTDGQPGYAGVHVQLFAGATPPQIKNSCDHWASPPGLLSSAYMSLESSTPNKEQLAAAAGLHGESLQNPVLSAGKLPAWARAEFKKALAGKTGYGWMRVVPLGKDTDPQHSIAPVACAAPPAGWVKFDVGSSPSDIKVTPPGK
jgi:hypothetical protein